MKFSNLFYPLALLALPLMNGCAKSPSGGVTNTAPNRLEATLTIDKTIDPNFYYGIAFDDIPNDGQGPIAVIGNSEIPNHVMDGSWRVLVLFHQNLSNPVIYYRSTPNDAATERQVLGTNLLFSTPRTGTNSFNFVLNLDAKLNDGTYFFAHTAGATPALAVKSLSINYVATNTIIIGNDQRIKPVDAYDASLTSTFFDFQIEGTRRTSITDPQGDKNFGIDSSFASVNFGQIDVRQLDLNVTRN